MRRWQPGAAPADFRRTAPATRIYRTDDEIDPQRGVTLHTVTTCELARPQMECASSAVLGPPGRVFYVSSGSVYVWTTVRSHGFYYRAETGEDGVVGLPIIGGGQAASGQLRRTSASLLYLRNRALELTELGALDARAEANANDNCRASCVDWYGNSRPLFVRNRVFALMGYEIVEGRIMGSRIAEVRRISFSPSWLD